MCILKESVIIDEARKDRRRQIEYDFKRGTHARTHEQWMQLFKDAGYTAVAFTGKYFFFDKDHLPVRMYCIMPTKKTEITLETKITKLLDPHSYKEPVREPVIFDPEDETV